MLAVLAGRRPLRAVPPRRLVPVGVRLSGSWRLAARSHAASRTRSAGVLTAIAVTGTAAIAITTAVGSLAFGDEHDIPIVPRDTIVLSSIRYDYTPPPGTAPEEQVDPVVEVVPLDDDLVAQVNRVIPDAQISPRRIVAPDWPTDRRQSRPPSGTAARTPAPHPRTTPPVFRPPRVT